MGKISDRNEMNGSPTSQGTGQPASSTPFEQLKSLVDAELKVQITEDHIQSVLSVRRGREALFGRYLFADPAWDIILELYAAKLGNRQLSAAELARAIGLPQSVITRWLAVLTNARLVTRDNVEHGSGEGGVRLTEEAAAKFARLVDQWTAAFVTI